MRTSYALAAGLSLLAAVLRTLDGEIDILPLVRHGVIRQEVAGFFHLTWYMVTIVFALSGIVLGYLAFRGNRSGTAMAGRFIGALFLVWSAAIAGIGFAFGWHPGLAIPMVVTLLIGVLALAGSRGDGSGAAPHVSAPPP